MDTPPKNNFIFVIIVVIVIIILIVAISNRGDVITHHHAKPHFDQPKNVMRLTASDHITNYTVFKVVMNDHSEETDQDCIETTYKGHEPDLSTTNLVPIAFYNNTASHGTDVVIPLDGLSEQNDPSHLILEGSRTDGRIETIATTTSTLSSKRIYTVTFPAGNYGLPPPDSAESGPFKPIPIISGLKNFNVSVIPGSLLSITNVVVAPIDSGKIDEENFFFLSNPCSNGTCGNVNIFANYTPLLFSSNNNVTYCFRNPNNGSTCVIPNLLMNASFAPKLTGVGFNPFVLLNPITVTLMIESSSLVNPCGTTPCP